jgi:hypothetical protein
MQSARLDEHEITGLDGGAYPRITFSGNRFHITGADGIERAHDQLYLNVVILDVAADHNKAWWSSLDASGPPDCFADDGRVPNGPESTRPLVTSGAATFPVRSCAECPKQLEGSKGDGSDFKACGTKKRMAVLLLDEVNGTELGTVYQMNLGAWSLGDKMPATQSGPRGLKQYQQFLKSQTGAGPNGIRFGAIATRVEFATDVSVPVLRFSVAARTDGYAMWLPVETQDAIADLISTDAVRKVINPSMTNRNSARPVALPAPVNEARPMLAQVTQQPAATPAQAITQVAAPAPARAKPPVAPKPPAAPPPPAPAPAAPTDQEVLLTMLNLYETAFPAEFADMAAWATHEATPLADALAWFKDNTPDLYAQAVPPVATPKLLAPPVAPAAPAKPRAKPAAKAAPVATPAATVLPASDGATDELSSMLDAMGADL